MNNIKFEDASGDKEFFTIVPNYILNHSTQCDRDVYIQIKRIAGENGECYMSRSKLAQQCGISVRRLDKSIKYLLDHKWIIDAGKKQIDTKGGKQYTNVYKVANLWDLNMQYYKEKIINKGIAPNTQPLSTGNAKNDTKGVQKTTKGGAPGAHKEDPFNNITNKEELLTLFNKNIQTDNLKEKEKFISYWTEKNPGGKELWKKQPVFDIKKRWDRWIKNANDWTKNKPTEQAEDDHQNKTPYYGDIKLKFVCKKWFTTEKTFTGKEYKQMHIWQGFVYNKDGKEVCLNKEDEKYIIWK